MLSRTRTWTYATRLCALVAVFLLLAACGGGGQSSGASSGQGAQGSAGQSGSGQGGGQAAAPKSNVDANGRFINPVTIEVFSVVRSVELAPPGPDWIVAKKVKEQLNIDLKMSWQTDYVEYNRLVLTRAAANDVPDVFVNNSPDIARDLGAQGLLADWTPYLKLMPSYVKDRDVEKLAPIGTFNGKLYALVTKSTDPYKRSINIRQDWLDKLGLQAPKTLDEYLAVAKAFTEKDPDGNGRADTWGWSGAVDTSGVLQYFDPIFGAYGALGTWRIDNNKLVYVPTSPERLEGLKFINRMVQEKVLDPDSFSQRGNDRGNKWKSGKVGIVEEDWCAAYCAGNFDPFAKAVPTGRLVDIQPPVGPNGKSGIAAWNRIGNRYSMSARAVQQGKAEAIARFLEWINTDGYYLVSFGVEGENWKREGNKIVADQSDASRIVKAFSSWSLKASEEELRARYDQTNQQPNGQTVAVWPILERAQKNPQYDETDFQALPPPPADKAGDLARLRAEAELAFAAGQRPFSQWDAYVQSMKAAGLDQWQAAAEARAKEIGLLK